MSQVAKYKKDPDIGGKAANLLRLEKIGANVPRWMVIPQHILLDQLRLGVSDSGEDMNWDNIVVPSAIISDVSEHFGPKSKEKFFAVRSSAMDEDGAQFSFAGQFETYLHVPFAELSQRIFDIWKSTQSQRVVAYRQQNDLPESFGIAVIIQEMVAAEVAGVAFGINPVTHAVGSKVISAVFGLGEGLVSGELDADTYTLKGAEVDKNIIEKPHAFYQKNAGSGIEKIEVPIENQKLPTLNDTQINEIAGLLDRLEETLGCPQDIEFAYRGETLFLLQTRPITTVKPEGEYTLWDNSNIIESYPGITTPLTFTFIIKMYERVYRQFVGILGVHEKAIEAHHEVFENTLGLVRGRVYYNLLNWYKMLAMVPGYSINAAFMEKMMGVSERFELQEDFRMSKGMAWYRTATMLWRMLKMQRRIPKERDLFLRQLNAVMKQYGALDFGLMSPKEIIAHYLRFEQDLLLKWKAPLINDFFAMIWFGMLEKQVGKLMPDHPNIHNDLLCGSEDIISVEPIHRSIAIAASVVADAEAKELFVTLDPIAIWKEMEAGKWKEIKASIDSYIHDFGERCVGELKLETVSYTQRPDLFVKIIKSYVEQGVTRKKSHGNIEDDLRAAAEKKVEKALKGKPLKRWWFHYTTRKARDLVSNRENLRYERTRGFGMVRRMFSALGERWHEMGLLDNPRDIFYLQLEEIKSAGDHGFLDSWKERISQRKETFETYRNQEIPQERFFTYGNYFADAYIYSEEKLEGAESDLKGIGCCPGIVRKRVQVIRDPSDIDSLNGDILVTSSTDPGWVTLFPTCSGIIVERGSLLSHSAIVSREMGIPCIVSVKGLLRTLQTGDMVEMDGSTGRIALVTLPTVA